MELTELQRAIEAILFAAGERVEIARLCATMEADESDVIAAVDGLANELSFQRRGIRILRLDDGYQMVSSGEMAEFVTKCLETRKPPKLSASQLETLTIVAYYQPATKAMVEQIRGVDSSYSVGALLNKNLIEETSWLSTSLKAKTSLRRLVVSMYPAAPFSIRPRRIFCAPSAFPLWKTCRPLIRSASANLSRRCRSRWSWRRDSNGLDDYPCRTGAAGDPAVGRCGWL